MRLATAAERGARYSAAPIRPNRDAAVLHRTGRRMRRVAGGCSRCSTAPRSRSPDPPARIDPDARAGSAPSASFEAFARDWMARARERRRARPREPAAHARRARRWSRRYREVGADFETRAPARPVGPDAPYVGVLRYTENVVHVRGSARAPTATWCRRVPVTEVFRLRDGRWVY